MIDEHCCDACAINGLPVISADVFVNDAAACNGHARAAKVQLLME